MTFKKHLEKSRERSHEMSGKIIRQDVYEPFMKNFFPDISLYGTPGSLLLF